MSFWSRFRKRSPRSRRSSRQGEIIKSPLRSRPLTYARVNSQFLKRASPLAPFAKLGRGPTIKGRRSAPAEQVREMVLNRYPFIPLQRRPDIFGTGTLYDIFKTDSSVLKDQLNDTSTPGSICQRRSDRRTALFKMKIAGKGKRRSPGQGGTYRRTPDSQGSCAHRR